MNTKKSGKMLVFATLLGAMMTFPALAIDLDSARASGKVGEKLDGYAVALDNSPDVTSLVADVNNRRRQEYAKISQENGQPASVVGKLAAAQIINRLPAGA